MSEYEVVYSAALERQGLCNPLSGFEGQSTLLGFDALDTLAHGDARALANSLRNYDPQYYGRNKRFAAWHAIRSKQAA